MVQGKGCPKQRPVELQLTCLISVINVFACMLYVYSVLYLPSASPSLPNQPSSGGFQESLSLLLLVVDHNRRCINKDELN